MLLGSDITAQLNKKGYSILKGSEGDHVLFGEKLFEVKKLTNKIPIFISYLKFYFNIPFQDLATAKIEGLKGRQLLIEKPLVFGRRGNVVLVKPSCLTSHQLKRLIRIKSHHLKEVKKILFFRVLLGCGRNNLNNILWASNNGKKTLTEYRASMNYKLVSSLDISFKPEKVTKIKRQLTELILNDKEIMLNLFQVENEEEAYFRLVELRTHMQEWNKKLKLGLEAEIGVLFKRFNNALK